MRALPIGACTYRILRWERAVFHQNFDRRHGSSFLRQRALWTLTSLCVACAPISDVAPKAEPALKVRRVELRQDTHFVTKRGYPFEHAGVHQAWSESQLPLEALAYLPEGGKAGDVAALFLHAVAPRCITPEGEAAKVDALQLRKTHYCEPPNQEVRAHEGYARYAEALAARGIPSLSIDLRVVDYLDRYLDSFSTKYRAMDDPILPRLALVNSWLEHLLHSASAPDWAESLGGRAWLLVGHSTGGLVARSVASLPEDTRFDASEAFVALQTLKLRGLIELAGLRAGLRWAPAPPPSVPWLALQASCDNQLATPASEAAQLLLEARTEPTDASWQTKLLWGASHNGFNSMLRLDGPWGCDPIEATLDGVPETPADARFNNYYRLREPLRQQAWTTTQILDFVDGDTAEPSEALPSSDAELKADEWLAPVQIEASGAVLRIKAHNKGALEVHEVTWQGAGTLHIRPGAARAGGPTRRLRGLLLYRPDPGPGSQETLTLRLTTDSVATQLHLPAAPRSAPNEALANTPRAPTLHSWRPAQPAGPKTAWQLSLPALKSRMRPARIGLAGIWRTPAKMAGGPKDSERIH